MYYNTTKLNTSWIEKYDKVSGRQDEEVFRVFQNEPDRLFTSHDIEARLEVYPRSSIVRSMNTLEKSKRIIKTPQQTLGKYGRLVHLYRLRKETDSYQDSFL